jgi:hypothetical protein
VASSIFGTIVDHEHVDAGQGSMHLRDHAADGALLVERGNEDQ